MLLGIFSSFNKANTSSGFILKRICSGVVSNGKNYNYGTFRDFS